MLRKNEMRGKIVFLSLLISGLLSSINVCAASELQSVPAENNHKQSSFDFAGGGELMFGDATYSIGYPITEVDVGTYDGYFPFSELEWPLNILMARVDGRTNIGSSWSINGTLKRNVITLDDLMIDKDWVTESDPYQLDVYSESEVSYFAAYIMDINAEWAFLQRPSWRLHAGLGCQYQYFMYEANLIYQYSPSGLPDWEFYGDGSVSITYELYYLMPYVQFGAEFKITPNLTVAANLAYSPLAQAQDEDHHLLTGKVSSGDMTGVAYMVDASGAYDFNSSLFVKGGLNYKKIEVDGDQYQSYGGELIYIVTEKLESNQLTSYLEIGRRF